MAEGKKNFATRAVDEWRGEMEGRVGLGETKAPFKRFNAILWIDRAIKRKREREEGGWECLSFSRFEKKGRGGGEKERRGRRIQRADAARLIARSPVEKWLGDEERGGKQGIRQPRQLAPRIIGFQRLQVCRDKANVDAFHLPRSFRTSSRFLV